jgi:hypothetical protein
MHYMYDYFLRDLEIKKIISAGPRKADSTLLALWALRIPGFMYIVKLSKLPRSEPQVNGGVQAGHDGEGQHVVEGAGDRHVQLPGVDCTN